MNRIKLLTYAMIAALLGLMMPGCVDDFPGWNNAGYLDGETTVSLEASFSPFAEGDLTRASVVNEGNGKHLDILNDLCILVYDTDGNIVDEDVYPKKIDFEQSQLSDDRRTDDDASNNKTAESTTKSLKGINLTLPFGTYYIVGVSNLKGGTLNTLTTTTDANGQPVYKSLQSLRHMKINWDNENLTPNSEMMGYFTDSDLSKGVPAADRPFQTVAVNRPGMKLHAWMRRAASKITIDFDGSNLRENVKVYIKEARIYDIAYDCTLGFGSVMTNSEGERDYNHRVNAEGEKPDGFFHENGQVISYAKDKGNTDLSDNRNFPEITKGTPLIKDNRSVAEYPSANVIDFHNEKAEALYFYENMQDNPDGKTKVPVPDLNNGVVNKGEDKDGIKYGTYIEVTGYYDSNADGNSSKGEIKYRFMIGKNVTDNFEAERNYHYKLTLKPRGNGNDADWHIEYEEPKGFHVPNPWYVSYLYNHDAIMPFKYTPDDGWEVAGLEAEIITNPWYPSDWEEDELERCKYPKTNFVLPPGATEDEQKDIEPADMEKTGDDKDPYEVNTSFNRGNWNGFLSLRVTNDVVITDNMAGTIWKGYEDANCKAINKNYYYGTGTSTSKIDRSKRIYMQKGKIYEYADYPEVDNKAELKERDKFTYQKQGKSTYFNIPLFTRAKVMVKQTGYSGNNLFVGYQRIARLKLTVTLQKIGDETQTKKDYDYVNVVQVRRVVNPKGVYRKSGNHEPFHVQMMWLDGDNARSFAPVISHGPWKAEIIGDPNFITLDGKQTVSGHTNEPIDFTIRFNRMNNDKKVRNAVVRIKYHNYTCTHLVFVRQGYDAQDLLPSADCIDHSTYPNGGATPVFWETCNMISENLPASDPRDEGSMFKFCNSKYAIDAINNIYKDDSGTELYHNLKATEFKNNTGPFKLVGDDGKLTDGTTAWDAKGFKAGSGFGGKMANAATMRHFEQLYLSENMQFGYGVLYADGATETKTLLSEAYGYYRRDADKSKGMRGMFAYYWDGKTSGGSSYNARNVFFPIGRAGYGHRKNGKEGDDDSQPGNGIQRYACNRGRVNTVFSDAGPIFVSIYRRPGGIYWARFADRAREWNGEMLENPSFLGYGLDINYFSFDVNLIYGSNIGNGADACFVRCVK